jgi:lauroyl/myristoyl acyltransferase
MGHSLTMRAVDGWRRAAMRGAQGGLLNVAKWTGPVGARRLGVAAGRAGGWVWPLRVRLAENLRRAGIEPTAERLDGYFRQLGLWSGWSLAAYHSGMRSSGLLDRIQIDPASEERIRAALDRGRGLVLSTTHHFGHELGFAAIHHRVHPASALVRQSKDPSWGQVKDRWYGALGFETVVRPRRASPLSDLMSCLRVLRKGKILGITSDILVKEDFGVPVTIFDRRVHLSRGIVVLAMRAKAPVLFTWGEWRDGVFWVFCDEPMELPVSRRDGDVGEAMQAWAGRAEAFLRQCPESWMFWLDKAWTRALWQPTLEAGQAL